MPTKSKPTNALVDFPGMVDALDLDTIQYYELGAKGYGGCPQFEEIDTNSISTAMDDVSTNWALRTRHEANQFGVRTRAEASNDLGALVADVAVEYVSSVPIRIPRETAYQFVNDVALMQVFPYIREAFTTLSTRVFGQGFVMPIIQRGQLTFTVPEDAPEISEG
jgi:hypothetical protein